MRLLFLIKITRQQILIPKKKIKKNKIKKNILRIKTTSSLRR